MLKKLLKYDIKSIFKFWWIAALTSFALALVGGGCITVLSAKRELPVIVDVSGGFVLILSIISFCLFAVVPTILIFVRYYKNFFTDEGYLTFTLPVKTTTLINSKLIMSVIAVTATGFVVVLDILTMLGIGFADEIFTKEFWEGFINIVKEIINEMGWYLLLYAIEGIIILLLVSLVGYLFLLCCITLASVITKKARIITSIGIYYGVSWILSFIMQMFLIFGMSGVAERMSDLSESMALPFFALGLFAVISLIATFCIMLYTMLFWMIDRKLNLA